MDASSTDSTMAAPTDTGRAIRSFRGTSLRMPIATATPPVNTPMKLQKPDQGTATMGFNALV